jgi:hypothetical protein
MSKREFVEYKGERFYIQTSGSYFQSGRKNVDERLLHRRIWADNFGPIPPGFDIHHKDDNWRNNDPLNLEPILQSEHRRLHMTARNNTAQGRATMLSGLEKAREAAKEWHRSAEGLEWHRKNGVSSWEDRKPFKKRCEACDAEYDAWAGTRSRFCSKRCGRRSWSATKLLTLALVCRHCRRDFMGNKYQPQKYCSPACYADARRVISK